MTFSVTSISNSAHANFTPIEPGTNEQIAKQNKELQILSAPSSIPVPPHARKFKNGQSQTLYPLFHKALSEVLGGYQSQSGHAFPSPLLSLIAEYEDQLIPMNPLVKSHFVSTIGFGKKMWYDYFKKNIGEVPPLPSNIGSILAAPCPFNPGSKVSQTHTLVLVPATLGGIPLTLRLFGELMHGLGLPSFNKHSYFGEHAETPFEASHWILITRNVPEVTRNMSYAEQLKYVERYPEYAVPKLAEAVAAIFMEHLATGVFLFGRGAAWTYTRCQEKTPRNDLQMVVGGFALDNGLDVDSFLNKGNEDVGLAPLRRIAAAT